MHDDISGKLVKSPQVMKEGFLNKVAFLHSCGANVPFQQHPCGGGNNRRDLGFTFHGSALSYIIVVFYTDMSRGHSWPSALDLPFPAE